MKKKALHVISMTIKWSGLVAIIAGSVDLKIGAIVIFATSALKDTLLGIGDWLDDGQRNNSFKGKL